MAVSNPATFASIKAEFGGSNNFKDYYAGGPYVATGISAGISTTADGLRMSQFNGVQNITFPLPSSVSATAAKAGLGATAVLTLNTTGAYSGTSSGNWVVPTSQATGLDVMVTKLSGTAPSGTLGTWLAMTSNRTWSLFADAGSDFSCVLQFQFRKTGTTTVIGTKNVTLNASTF